MLQLELVGNAVALMMALLKRSSGLWERFSPSCGCVAPRRASQTPVSTINSAMLGHGSGRPARLLAAVSSGPHLVSSGLQFGFSVLENAVQRNLHWTQAGSGTIQSVSKAFFQLSALKIEIDLHENSVNEMPFFVLLSYVSSYTGFAKVDELIKIEL